MDCLPIVKQRSEGIIYDKVELAVLIRKHSHSERRKDCERNSALLVLNGFTLEQKSDQCRI